jgi:hypothetical protein
MQYLLIFFITSGIIGCHFLFKGVYSDTNSSNEEELVEIIKDEQFKDALNRIVRNDNMILPIDLKENQQTMHPQLIIDIKLLENIEFDEKDLGVINILSNDYYAKRIKTILILNRYHDKVASSEIIKIRLKSDLFYSPEKSFELIKVAIEQLVGITQKSNRIELINIASNFNKYPEEVARLSLIEITDFDDNRERANIYNEYSAEENIMLKQAYGLFLENSKNRPDDALEGTVASIQAQKDIELKLNFARLFMSNFPILKEDFYSKISEDESFLNIIKLNP